MNGPPPQVEPLPTLRTAMRQLAGGVGLVTTGDGHRRAGFTATSITSLTLEPPCLLVCVNRKVSALPALLSNARFGVSLLADHQAPLATRFSGVGGIKGAARFDEAFWRQSENHVPLLDEALAAIACDLEDAIERHSHVILIGAVRGIDLGPQGRPLIYAQGRYGAFSAPEPA